MAEQVEGHTGDARARGAAAVEAATEQKERALVQSSRLAAIGTLAAGVAHEINNPIGGMQNAVNRLLQSRGPRPTSSASTCELVQRRAVSASRARRSGVLDFSPRDSRPRAFPLATAIEGARALVEHRLQPARTCDSSVDLAARPAAALRRRARDPAGAAEPAAQLARRARQERRAARITVRARRGGPHGARARSRTTVRAWPRRISAA